MPIIDSDYIRQIIIIKQLRELFVNFTGLDIQILDINSKPLRFSCSQNRIAKTLCDKHTLFGCNHISDDLFNKVVSSGATQVFKCRAGLAKILVPMLLNGEAIGIVFVGENNFSRLDGGKLDSVSKLLYRAVNYIIEIESNSLKHFKGNPLTRRQQILHRVMKDLQSNYRDNQVSLKEIARDNGISYYYLSHLFKRELNTSFTRYRTDIKMDAAAKLLRDFGLNIDQISEACGFNDAAYFCKVFKTSYGCSPGDFRQKIISKQKNGDAKERNGVNKQKIAIKRQIPTLTF